MNHDDLAELAAELTNDREWWSVGELADLSVERFGAQSLSYKTIRIWARAMCRCDLMQHNHQPTSGRRYQWIKGWHRFEWGLLNGRNTA